MASDASPDSKLLRCRMYNVNSFDTLYTCEAIIVVQIMNIPITPRSFLKPLYNPYFPPLLPHP